MRIEKLDCPHVDVRMYVETKIEETHRIIGCSKEPWTCDWIRAMPPGSVLYDVGANVGPYTLMAAALGHTVVAIEPSFANYARLCENVLLNDLSPKVIPLCVALARIGGHLEVMQQEPQPGYSGGTKRLRVPVMGLVDVMLQFDTPSPTHIKVDVDGPEAHVIAGCEGLLRDVSWMVEVQDGHEHDIYQLLGEPARIFSERNGKKIPGMSMCLFEPTRILAPA